MPLSRVVWLVAALELALHASSSLRGYGIFVDEFYYLACADRLAWGYVDQPPLSIALLAGWTSVFGESLAAIRMAPALLGSASVVAAALLARELGGGARAQTLTAVIAAIAPVNLVVQGYYSMNAIDILVWEVAFISIARLVRKPTGARWLMWGALLGLGLLNKYSAAWLGMGFGVGLIVTPHRRLLATPWPWAAGVLALLIFSPHVVWQWTHDFPTLEFMSVALAEKMRPVGALDLFAQQVLVMHPLALPVWVAGFFLLWRAGTKGPERIFAMIFVTTALILIANGTSRPNYLALAQPPLVAAGAIGIERLGLRSRWHLLPAAAIALVSVFGLLMSVFSLPILPPGELAELSRRIGLGAPQMENHEMGALDQHLADMIGWDIIVNAVADAWDALPDEDRAHAGIIGLSYAMAGPIELLGRDRGLPVPSSPHNSYWHWGPGSEDGSVVLIVGGPLELWAPHWAQIDVVGTWDCGYCMPSRNHQSIYLARQPRAPIDEIWQALRSYR